jgi:hypothetical protein
LRSKPIRSEEVDFRPEKIYIGRSEAGNSKSQKLDFGISLFRYLLLPKNPTGGK